MKKVLSIAVAGCALASAGTSAAVSESEWNAFKVQFQQMQERISALEAENQALRGQSTLVKVEDLSALQNDVASLKASEQSSSWTDTISLKGDFRYRFEDIRDDDSDRERNRVRARAAIVAKPSADVEAGLGFATGGDDPVSTNQTLGGGGSTKDVRLDLAYLTWSGLENTFITAGKYSNPLYRVQKSGLIWDGDFRPEGLVLGWSKDSLFATATYSFLESDSKRGNNALWGAQVGAKLALTESLTLTAAAKYLEIPSKGAGAIFDDDFFGNSSIEEGGELVYAFDYNVVNASLDLGFDVLSMPVNVYADYIENTDADDLDTGYLAGVKVGKASKANTWQFQYQYQMLEADATLGLITDSDFAGGGTDGEGHKFSVKYAIDNRWYVGATYFDTQRGVDLGRDSDYRRLMIDTGVKY